MTTLHRVTNRLRYLNSSIEVVQRLPAGADDWFLAGGAPMPVAVYNVREGGSLAGSYVNVVNPGTFNAAPGVAPTWSGATGWGFNGTTQFLLTGIVPLTSAWGMLVRFSAGLTTGDRVLAGSFASTTSRFHITAQAGAGNNHYYGNTLLLEVSGSITSGVLAFAGQSTYKDGLSDGTIPAGGAVSTRSTFIGALNLLGNPSVYFSGNIQYVAIWNTSTGHATWMPQVSAAVALL